MAKLAKSPLRYPGGKSRALKQILPLIPVNMTEFREPFVGGGSVFFAIRSSFGTVSSPIGLTTLIMISTVSGNR